MGDFVPPRRRGRVPSTAKEPPGSAGGDK